MTAPPNDEFRASFFEECEELLEAMQDGFTHMVDGVGDAEAIHIVFRSVHSIKGGAGAFGLNELVDFAHAFETALDAVRSGRVHETDEILFLCQQCGDHLGDLVAAAREGEATDPTKAKDLLNRLYVASGTKPGDDDRPDPEEGALDFVPLAINLGDMNVPPPVPPKGWELSLRADPELFTSGNEPLLLFRALERFGRVKAIAAIDDVPLLSRLDPMMCNLSWNVSVETDVGKDVLMDVFDFVLDCAEITAAPLAKTEGPGAFTPTATKRRSEPGAEAQHGTPGYPVRQASPDLVPPRTKTQTIRVDFERVDKLINLVGELVIKEAMLSQALESSNLSSGKDVHHELDGLKQLAGEIQEGVMAIRAQPIKPLFQRMARTVRDASAATGKQVRLVMNGECSEIDKTVIERLVDPLTHMVRNSVDHGLEVPEQRVHAGKPVEGVITLSAAHRSGRVVIEISDDGAGIDRAKIRKIAEARGLIPSDAVLTDAEVDALLFMPGFSSVDEISELSGRGVGLDVVRSEINALRGRLSVSAEPGKGTTFTISLPLTLAVLEGMVVDVAGQTMVVPVTAIKETLYAGSAQCHTIGPGVRVLSLRGILMPVTDLGMQFGYRDNLADDVDQIFLVIETEDDKRCALLVDGLHDQRQVVIKSLETNYCQIDGIAAATILGDGRIALIVDPEGIAAGLSSTMPTPAPDKSPILLEGGAA